MGYMPWYNLAESEKELRRYTREVERGESSGITGSEAYEVYTLIQVWADEAWGRVSGRTAGAGQLPRAKELARAWSVLRDRAEALWRSVERAENGAISRLALATARVFAEEFPGDLPDVTWLAEAAAIDGVSDGLRERYFLRVRREVSRIVDMAAQAELHAKDGGPVPDTSAVNALMMEAGAVGDDDLVALCRLALGLDGATEAQRRGACQICTHTLAESEAETPRGSP